MSDGICQGVSVFQASDTMQISEVALSRMPSIESWRRSQHAAEVVWR